MNEKKLIAVTIGSYTLRFTGPNVPRGGSGGPLVGRVQLRLARAGYYRGSIDGMSGNLTPRAIREYERAHGLQEDG